MKTNKNIVSAILVFALIATGIYSCTDDFLEEVDRYNIDSETYFNSEDDYYMALIGAYDMLQSTSINVLMGEIASDNTLCGGEGSYDTPGYQQVDDMTHNQVNEQLKRLWDWMFAGVNRANYFLEFQDKTNFEGRNAMIAEVRFLRAYYHFELVKWFGGIPIKNYDAALDGEGVRFSPGDEQSLSRLSKQQVYAVIENDLIFATNNLEYNAPQVGRVTKGAAEALLGKAYLYQQKFSEAAIVLDNVIGNGPYNLEYYYADIFEAEGENNVESVFEVQYTDAEGAGFGCFQCSEGNIAVGYNGIRNHNGPLYDSGFSFNVPTQEAVDSFEDEDTRKEVSILDIEAWAVETGATYGIGYEHTGYYNRKYIARKGDLNTGDQNLTNPNNYRAIRFADVLLMASEAHSETGNDNQAKVYLNRVRERAFRETSVVYEVTANGEDLKDAIYHERRVELVGEGHRFFDLVRTGQASSEIEGFQAGKHELFPIPIQEIQFSNGNWSQNPNY